MYTYKEEKVAYYEKNTKLPPCQNPNPSSNKGTNLCTATQDNYLYYTLILHKVPELVYSLYVHLSRINTVVLSEA